MAHVVTKMLVGEIYDRETRQTSVLRWCAETFGNGIEVTPGVRLMRFIEEATEMAQAFGLSKADVQKVVSYVYARPVGELSQEVGGVAITLMAFVESVGLSLPGCELTEIQRINAKDPERFKQRAREKGEANLIPTPKD